MRLDSRHLRIALLTVLLLCGQALVMAHELGHDLRAVDGYCPECLIQSALTDSLAPDHQCFPVLEIGATVISLVTSSYSQNKLLTNTARAPPFSS